MFLTKCIEESYVTDRESYALEKYDIKINDERCNYGPSFSNSKQCEYTLSSYSQVKVGQQCWFGNSVK